KMMAETQLSTLLQVVTAVVFLVHALFAFIVYLVGMRDKRLIYFALLVIVLSLINLNGGDEKVLLQYWEMNYTFVFKYSMFTMILLPWAMIHALGEEMKQLSKYILPVTTIVSILFLLISFLLPLQ